MQAPSLSGKSHVEELDDGDQNMDTSRMMFNWADQGMGQGFTQEQVDGEFAGIVLWLLMLASTGSDVLVRRDVSCITD